VSYRNCGICFGNQPKEEKDPSTFLRHWICVHLATAAGTDSLARELQIAIMSNGNNGGSYQKDSGAPYQPINVNGGENKIRHFFARVLASWEHL